MEQELEQLQELDTYVQEMEVIEQSFSQVTDQFNEKASQFQDAGGYERVLIESMKKEMPAYEQHHHLRISFYQRIQSLIQIGSRIIRR